MKYFLNWRTILVSIVIFAAILRFWQLGNVPLGFHEDESAYGYNAYSLLLTGKDEYGKSFPLVLKSFGEYKPALYAYLTVPWVAIFDLNPFSVRLTTAIFGLLTIPLLYFLVKKMFNNQRIAMIAALLLAISPWHLNLSRTTSEVVVSLFFILLLIYAIFSFKEKFHIWWFLATIISGVFAIYSYTASRFFVVILCILLTLIFTKIKNKKLSVNPRLLLLCGIFICIGFITTELDSASRFNQISVLSTPETQLILNEQLREDHGSPLMITRLFHNKIINYARTIGQNFSEYFTLNFFVFKGGVPDRLIVPNTGLFYFWQLPFLLLGLYVLIRKRNVLSIFLIGWWFLLLLPASLTYHEIPNVYRSLIILPPLLIIGAIGINTFLFETRLNKFFLRGSIGIFCVLSLFEIGYYLHQYYIHQENHRPWQREYAYNPLTTELEKLSDNYKQIVITTSHGEPYIHLLFYNKYNPALYQQESLIKKNYEGFGKYHFVQDDCLTEGTPLLASASTSGALYIVRGECKVPRNFKKVKTINWQDNTPAFQLVEYSPRKLSPRGEKIQALPL